MASFSTYRSGKPLMAITDITTHSFVRLCELLRETFNTVEPPATIDAAETKTETEKDSTPENPLCAVVAAHTMDCGGEMSFNMSTFIRSLKDKGYDDYEIQNKMVEMMMFLNSPACPVIKSSTSKLLAYDFVPSQITEGGVEFSQFPGRKLWMSKEIRIPCDVYPWVEDKQQVLTTWKAEQPLVLIGRMKTIRPILKAYNEAPGWTEEEEAKFYKCLVEIGFRITE